MNIMPKNWHGKAALVMLCLLFGSVAGCASKEKKDLSPEVKASGEDVLMYENGKDEAGIRMMLCFKVPEGAEKKSPVPCPANGVLVPWEIFYKMLGSP